MAALGRRGVSDEEAARLRQHLVRDFPILHAGSIPYRETPSDWDFRVWGAVETPLRWTMDELRSQDITRLTCDIDHDEPGFWERLGYSNTADPWKEERYGF